MGQSTVKIVTYFLNVKFTFSAHSMFVGARLALNPKKFANPWVKQWSMMPWSTTDENSLSDFLKTRE